MYLILLNIIVFALKITYDVVAKKHFPQEFLENLQDVFSVYCYWLLNHEQTCTYFFSFSLFLFLFQSRSKYEKVHTIYRRLLSVPDLQPTLVYVQYMKFARRAQGIQEARAVFKLAREDGRTQYPAYVAAALTEYYCSKVSSQWYTVVLHSNKVFSATQ